MRILTEENYSLSRQIQMLQGFRQSTETLSTSAINVQDNRNLDNELSIIRDCELNQAEFLNKSEGAYKRELEYLRCELSTALKDRDIENLKLNRDIKDLKKKNRYLITKISEKKMTTLTSEQNSSHRDERESGDRRLKSNSPVPKNSEKNIPKLAPKRKASENSKHSQESPAKKITKFQSTPILDLVEK